MNRSSPLTLTSTLTSTLTLLTFSRSCLLLSLLCSGLVTSCPVQCECKSQYYVYCQDAAIGDQHLIDVISRVPPSAILIDLSANRISRMAGNLFSRLHKLEYLILAGNRLEELADHTFSNLTLLRELHLQNNQISRLGLKAFATLTHLEELHLASNSLTSLPSGVFSQLASLKKLRLFGNAIAHLKAYTFSGLHSLELLNLSNNRLKALGGSTFSGLTSLKKLNLNRNNLSSFQPDAFQSLNSLLEIDLSHNDISDLQFLHGNDFATSLQQLYLSHNKVNNIPAHAISGNRKLKSLDLSSNRIHNIAGKFLSGLSLDYLKLDKNRLTEISREIFKEAARISHLNISSNAIADIKTGAFDSFRETVLVLDLKFNKMTYIHPGMFRRMTRMRSLYLAHNAIASLDTGSFASMTLLHDLDLSHTRLTSLSRDTIAGPGDQLRNLLLAGTPLTSLSGFVLEDSTDRVFIEVNGSASHVTETTALIGWPYTHGSQLYWKVTLTCLDPPGCSAPPHLPNLRSFVTNLTLSGLTSGHAYSVCVNPVFLSPDAILTQCVRFQTDLTQSDSSIQTTEQGRQLEGNTGHRTFVCYSWLCPLRDNYSCCLTISLIVFLLLWTKRL